MYNLKKLIKDVFEPTDETFILLNDFPGSESKLNAEYIERREMIKEWEKTLKEMKLNVILVIYYEPTNSHGAPLPDKAMQNRKQIDLNKILDSLDEKSIVVAITTFSSTGPLQTRVKKQNFRAATLPGATMDMSAFEADYKLVAKKAHILAQKLTEAQAATVTFSSGHAVYFDLRDSKGHADDGVCQKPGQLINLPSGEAFITPKDVRGSKTHGFLPVQYDKHIVVYEVQENKIVDVIGDSPKTIEMQKFFKEDPARGNIAELGLGCNEKATFINSVLQDEKIEGMHWAYGYNKYMGGSVDVTDFKDPSQAVHQDIIYTKEAPIKIKDLTLIYKDGTKEVILENSRYSFNIKKLF